MKILPQMMTGAAGGLAGAFAMSLIMMAGKQMGMVRTPKPEVIVHSIERKTGTEEKTTSEQDAALAQAMHHAIGAGYGAGYGLLRSATRLPGIIVGPLYGMVVYLINEFGIGPGFRLTLHPRHEPRPTVVRRFLMHLVYGAVLSLIYERMRERYA